MKVCILLCIFLTACGAVETVKPNVSKANVLVLCDASNSTMPRGHSAEAHKGLARLKEYVEAIPGWYAFNSRIYYYPVSDNLVSDLLGKEVSYRVEWNSDLGPQKDSVNIALGAVDKALDTLALTTKNSCILLSIRRCLDKFREIARDNPDSGYSNELIIISDLVECCHVVEMNGRPLDVSNLDLKVRVFINSPWMGSNFEKVRAFWEDEFARMGVKKENLYFYTSKPDMPVNNLLKELGGI